MKKIRLDISGDLVGITIPSPIVLEEAEKELEKIIKKNYNLLKTLKFYNLMSSDLSREENYILLKIIETMTNLKPLGELVEYKKSKKINNFKFYYGDLDIGKRIISKTNLIVLGDAKINSHINCKESIFIYGKVDGILQAGTQWNVEEKYFIYVEEFQGSKIIIGDKELVYDEKISMKQVLFENKYGEIEAKELDENMVKELMEKIGLTFI